MASEDTVCGKHRSVLDHGFCLECLQDEFDAFGPGVTVAGLELPVPPTTSPGGTVTAGAGDPSALAMTTGFPAMGKQLFIKTTNDGVNAILQKTDVTAKTLDALARNVRLITGDEKGNPCVACGVTKFFGSHNRLLGFQACSGCRTYVDNMMEAFRTGTYTPKYFENVLKDVDTKSRKNVEGNPMDTLFTRQGKRWLESLYMAFAPEQAADISSSSMMIVLLASLNLADMHKIVHVRHAADVGEDLKTTIAKATARE